MSPRTTGDFVSLEVDQMCNGEHRPVRPSRVVATVALPRCGSQAADSGPLLELRAGSCGDRNGADVAYVALIGELDGFTGSQIREPLLGIAGLTGDLVIDTNLVSFIDSAGLRLLEDVSGRVATNGNTVWLHDPSRVVTRLMRLVGVDEVIATCTRDRTEQGTSGPGLLRALIR